MCTGTRINVAVDQRSSDMDNESGDAAMNVIYVISKLPKTTFLPIMLFHLHIYVNYQLTCKYSVFFNFPMFVKYFF